MKNILAIETSCDDTSVAIVSKDKEVLSLVSAHQDFDHKPFGGIVPEIAGRQHTLALLPLIEESFKKASLSWEDISGLAVTNRPGLIGSLLVGVLTAKTLSLVKQKPWVGVNHLEGHIWAPFLKDAKAPFSCEQPFVALVVSGGHTHLYHVQGFGNYTLLGRTLDDAAGEAFDKFAKMLNLGFPGGVQVDRHAQKGNAQAFSFPRPLIEQDNLNFSFSGLKTAALRLLENTEGEKHISDLCASYQEAIVSTLVSKLKKATKQLDLKQVVVTGGVSANSQLRKQVLSWGEEENIQCALPPLKYCTDNAAMIGYVGLESLKKGMRGSENTDPSATSLKTDFGTS